MTIIIDEVKSKTVSSTRKDGINSNKEGSHGIKKTQCLSDISTIRSYWL